MADGDLFQAFALGLPNGAESPPVVLARGEFDLAAFMVSVAHKYGVPVVEKPEMCEVLESVELGESIPRELFEAAAALLVEIGALHRGEPPEADNLNSKSAG